MLELSGVKTAEAIEMKQTQKDSSSFEECLWYITFKMADHI